MSPTFPSIWQEKHTSTTHADHLHTQEATTQHHHKFDAYFVDFIKFLTVQILYYVSDKEKQMMVLVSGLFLIVFDYNSRL